MRQTKATMLAVGITAMMTGATAFGAQGDANWPNRTMTLIVPFAAGGGGDTLARLVADPLAKTVGQSIVVENHPGAGGNIGSAAAARAKADGYTFLYGTNGTQAINHALYKSVGYKPDQLKAVGRFSTIELTLVVARDNAKGIGTIADLRNYRAGTDKPLTCGSAGNGTSSHLACEMFKKQTGMPVTHVPYKGNAAAVTDIIGGRIDFIIDVTPNVISQVKAGRLKALAVTSKSPSPSLPGVPTLDASGLKGFEFYAWDGLYAPADTPPEVINKMNAAIDQTLKLKETDQLLRGRGAVPSPMTPEQFQTFTEEEKQRLGAIVRDIGATVD